MKQVDWRDNAIRTLLLASGALAAVLMTLKGNAPAVPALAIGAVLGTFFVTGFESSEE
jgi:hypothetical protein